MPRGAHLKDKPRTPGSGRRPGSLNKSTRTLRELIEAALIAAGGQEYLTRMAHQEPCAFLALVGRLLPRDVRQEITGKDGGPIEIGRGVPRLTKDEWLRLHFPDYQPERIDQ